MFWKVNYEYDNKKDCQWYSGAVSIEEKNRRNEKLRELGFKVISCYQVKNM